MFKRIAKRWGAFWIAMALAGFGIGATGGCVLLGEYAAALLFAMGAGTAASVAVDERRAALEALEKGS